MQDTYVCHFTGVEVNADEVVFVGATIPGVDAKYPMANTAEARAARKESAIAFHDSEANCNTCKFLQRTAHDKHWLAFLEGRCTNPNAEFEHHPYVHLFSDGVMKFHPDDPMHMPCYVSRW